MRVATAFDKLSKDEREETINRILKKQDYLSYISQQKIDLKIHKIDVDHIISLDRKGLDNESNWGVVIDTENKSKGTRDLQLMRYLYRFRQHSENYLNQKRDFNLGDALNEFFPKREKIKVEFNEERNRIIISYNNGIENKSVEYFLLEDSIDKKIKSFVGMIPFKIVNHDSTINPRSIVDLEPLIEEFYNLNPQLFPSLALLEIDVNGWGTINIFDGQHKAAAQLYNRSQNLFLRVFVNADKAKIKKTNLRAHTVVAQIHFPQLISDKVGHDLYKIEFEPFIDKVDLERESEHSFIKQVEINDEFKKYQNNYYRYNSLINNDDERHIILNYVETISSRSKKYPISYDTLSKTFFKLIYNKPSELNLKKSLYYRKLELHNLRIIMQLFVEEVLNKKFDFEIGIFKLEEKLNVDSDSISNNHLVAYRICRQSAFIIWIAELKKAIALLLRSRQKYEDNHWGYSQPLWANLDENDFRTIRNMIKVICMHNIWITKENRELLRALGSTKQGDWMELLTNGKLPGREDRYFQPLNYSSIYHDAIIM